MVKQRGVRVYVGTRKGAYAIEGDAARRRWKVRGPYHTGSDVFQVAPDPRHPGTVYAAVNSVFFGPMLQRSTDEGKHWKEIAPPMMPVSKARPPPELRDGPSGGRPADQEHLADHPRPGERAEAPLRRDRPRLPVPQRRRRPELGRGGGAQHP